ncbi:MAG TPA: hypothetical protein PLD10_12285 [Rhodopila sp.]|nr:hypothetical protein [Rhodopila sp.]
MMLFLLCRTISLELGVAAAPEPVPAHHTARIPPETEVTVDPMQASPHAAWVADILSRPLFSPDRRPMETAAGVVGLSRLTGIIVDGTRRIAIFAAGPGGKPVTVEVGSRIARYDVRAISHAGVTLFGPDGRFVIHPAFDVTRPYARTRSPGPAALLKSDTK